MAIDWPAASVIITVVGILCGVFYRLGYLSESKADKITCATRVETCADKFLAADQSAAKLFTAVARVEEQQKAGAVNLERQIMATDRLENILAGVKRRGIPG